MNKQSLDKNLLTNLLEMKDWKQHFTNGTKGMPKTDPRILKYVENILKKSYDNNEEKVNNNPIAPYLVKVITEIGPENINTEKINRISAIINYVKKTGNVANMPKMDLTQASDFAKEKLDKFDEKEKLNQIGGEVKPEETPAQTEEKPKEKKELTPQQLALKYQKKSKELFPELDDEVSGKLERVWTSTDGSGRIWVKVIDNSWLKARCATGEQWGIVCQGGSFGNSNYVNYQFIGPPVGKKAPIITIVGMGVLKAKASIGEVKQEGNVQPGSQSTSGGWKDADEQLIDFLSYSPEAKWIQYFGDYNGNIQLNANNSLEGGGIGFLYHLAKKKPDLFKKLASHRPDIIQNNEKIIRQLFPNVDDLLNFNITEYAEKNPMDFLRGIENYLKRYGKEAKDALDKLDLVEIAKTSPSLVESVLSSLTGVIELGLLQKIINSIDLSDYFHNNRLESYALFKKMSLFTDHKNILKNLVTKYSQQIMSSSGGGTKGAINFLKEMEKPKLDMHADAVKDLEDGKYYSEREVFVKDGNGNNIRRDDNEFLKRIERFQIPDNLLIMSQKERRDFLNQNKEEIKNSIKTDERGKEITFLRLLFAQSNNQDIEKSMKSEKEEFVKYYDDKFKLGEKKRVQLPNEEKVIESKYIPGEFELFSIINPKNIKTNDNKVYYPIGVENAKKSIINIIKHYHDINTAETVEEIKKQYPNRLTKEILNAELNQRASKRKYSAVKDYILTLIYSGEKEEKALEYFLTNFNPKKMKLAKYDGYTSFFNVLYTTFSHGLFYETLEKYKEELFELGQQGSNIYYDYMRKLEVKQFVVKPGDMVMCDNDDDMIFYMGDGSEVKKVRPKSWDANLNKDVIDSEPLFLTYKRYYKVLEVGDYAGSKNGKILIMDEGYYENEKKHVPPTKRWFNSNLFNIKTTTFANKLDEEKTVRDLIKSRIRMISENKKKTIAYTGIVLDRKSQEKLYEWIKQMMEANKLPNMNEWTKSADHVTINPGKSINETLLGKHIEIKVLQYAFDDKIAAVSIIVLNGEEIEFSKEKPHITLAYDESQGARPVMSNNLINWKPVPKSFVLSGTIMEA